LEWHGGVHRPIHRLDVHHAVPDGPHTSVQRRHRRAGIAGSIIAGSLFKRGGIDSFAGAATVVAALLVGLTYAGTLPWLAGLLLALWACSGEL
jgi:hypothetical protein